MNNNLEMAELIINYANSNNIILKINELDMNKNYPFLLCIIKNNIDMAKLIINYSIKNSIKLSINEKNNFNYNPLLCSIKNNNIELVKLIVDYANKTDIKLNIEENDIRDASKINKDIEEILKYYKNSVVNKTSDLSIKKVYPSLNDLNGIQEFLKENGYNESRKDINEIFLNCIAENQLPKFKLILEYANKNNITVNVNALDMNGNYSILWCTNTNNIEMTKLLIDYADSKRIILKINEINLYGNYPLLWCTMNNNLDMTKLLMNYAVKYNVILNINEKNKNNDYPLLCCIKNNSIEMVKLIIDYVKKNNIILNVEDTLEIPNIDKGIKEILENYKYYKNENGGSSSKINNNNNYNNKKDNINNENYNSDREKGKNSLNSSKEDTQFAIAEYDFISRKEEELNFKKGDKIRIINWNFKEGWAYGCKSDDLSKMGVFPKPLVTFENNNNTNKGYYIIIIIF